jgi:hypothetical protein
MLVQAADEMTTHQRDVRQSRGTMGVAVLVTDGSMIAAGGRCVVTATGQFA